MSGTEGFREHYDRLAGCYDISDWLLERFRYRKLRPIVWSYARGKTLDLGVGTGLNIPYYPMRDLEKVVGADLSSEMLARAKLRARRLGVAVEFHQMDAASLGFPDGSFDTVVSTFLFCVLPDEVQPQALSEARRVLKPGGILVLLEYAYSQNPARRLVMKALSPYVRWLYKAGFDRKTVEFLRRDERWSVEADRFIYKDVVRLVVAKKIG